MKYLPLFILAILLVATPALATYQYAVPITVTSTASIASGTLSNFPMLVSSTLSQWIYPGQHIQNICTAPNGNQEPCDLAFATSSANCNLTPLNFETESYVSSTGALIDWVNVPTMSTGTTIYACYDDATVSADQSHPSSTWNSLYHGVWHLPIVGGVVNKNDSTAYANNSTATSSIATTTIIDGGAYINGQATSTYIVKATSSLYLTTPFTVSCWLNVASSGLSTDISECISEDGLAGAARNFDLGTGATPVTQWRFTVFSATGTAVQPATTVGFATSTWTYLVGTWDGTLDNLYVNGLLRATGSITSVTSSLISPLVLGGRATSTVGDLVIGSIDELRYASSSLSPSWILTEYNNQNSPSTFYSVGNEVSTMDSPFLSSD